MPDAERRAGSLVWGLASRARGDASVSGDRATVILGGARSLLAVVDGLGHGPDAALAAQRAIDEVTGNHDEEVIALVRRCHEALRGTRGAVMSLAHVTPRDDSLTWIGVGNVSGILVRADQTADPAREGLVLRGGVVGYHLPSLLATVLPLMPGDTILLATDGLRDAFADQLTPADDPQHMADDLLARFAVPEDDALVLVARYQRGTP